MLKSLSLVLRDSPLESPFVPKKKEIAPAVAAAAITGGAMLANGIGNLWSQADTNKTNRQIAEMNMQSQRETNNYNKMIADAANSNNYRMFKEQNAWNEEMWNKQNEYNSPEHMVELYKRAGLNPAMLAGQVTPAGGLQSADSKPTLTSYATAPQLNYRQEPLDFSGVGNAVGTAVNSYYQNRLMDSERKKTDIESSGQSILNDNLLKQAPWQLKKLIEESKREGVLGDLARNELAYRLKAFDTRINMLFGDAAIQQKNMKILDEQLDSIQLDNQMKRIMNAFQPQWNDVQLKQANLGLQQIRANIGLILANQTLTYEQAAHEIEKKTSTVIDNGMKAIDYGTKKRLKETIIESAVEDLNTKFLDNTRRRYDLKDYHFDKFIKRSTSFVPFVNGFNFK